MKRLHEQNINTSSWFDEVWAKEGVHAYDTVRMNAFLEGIAFYETMLDVGAGWMGIAQYALQHDRVEHAWAVDFSEVAAKRTRASLGWKSNFLRYIIGDVRQLSSIFQKIRFDRVCCGELIEHMEDPEALICEMSRVCKPGGKLVVGTLDDTCEDAIRHGDYPEHLWSFTPDELVKFMRPYVRDARYRCVGDYHFVEGTVRI